MNESNDIKDKPSDNVADMHREESERRLYYECEQALLRIHCAEPSVEDEWKSFRASLSPVEPEALGPFAKTGRRRYWGWAVAVVSVAALLTGLVLLLHLPGGGYPERHAMELLIASEAGEREVVMEESAEELSADDGGTSVSVDARTELLACDTLRGGVRHRVVLPAGEADYTRTLPKKTCRYQVSIPRGKVYKIRLSDGTEVWLNADSRFSFPSRFAATGRRVVELDGEAYFKVAPDARRPFVILTRKMTTQVLGTEFNVKAYKDSEAHVTLVRGAVRVRPAHTDEEVTLAPGDDIYCTDSSYQVKQVDTSYYSQWMEGYFYYDNVALSDILRDLGRWYNVSVEIEQESSLLGLRLHFVAEREKSIDHVIENLNAYKYLSVVKEGDRLIVRRKKDVETK